MNAYEGSGAVLSSEASPQAKPRCVSNEVYIQK